ncbi:hypothetical protein LR48_Vigan08g038800 [Vigna angularis]|uniref:Uncharacterized protein n=1 Tax=Phaseolus angularis TaxID=3914 RepID=A0A0L9V3M5_PHAAN|nr:hypothetical protein LR48_Vigan08g038800 [Vigna angularis]
MKRKPALIITFQRTQKIACTVESTWQQESAPPQLCTWATAAFDAPLTDARLPLVEVSQQHRWSAGYQTVNVRPTVVGYTCPPESGRPAWAVRKNRRGGVRWRVRTCAGGEESKSEIFELILHSSLHASLCFISENSFSSLALCILSSFSLHSLLSLSLSLSLRNYCFISSNSGFRQRGRTHDIQGFQRGRSVGEAGLRGSEFGLGVRLNSGLTSVGDKDLSGERLCASVNVRSFPEGDERLEELLEEENLVDVEVKTKQ